MKDASGKRKSQLSEHGKEDYWRGIKADEDLPVEKAPKIYFQKRSVTESSPPEKPQE
jgi:hypothetical protein